MKFLTKIALIVLVLGATLLAKDVATITGLNGKAFIERDGKKIELRLGDKLQEKDTVLTNDKAKVQIIFEDETIVTVGKNSNFSVNEYLFEENQEDVAKFGMLKGAMRTITGKIGKIAPDKFSVVTKTATIGIRGTNFSVIVGEDNEVKVYCTYGTISVTVNGVEYIVKQGFYITVSADGNVEIKAFSSQDLKEMKEQNFGKSVAKSGAGFEDATAVNDGLLDNTREHDSNLVIKDITDTNSDSIQTSIGVEYYVMSDASYDGTFTETSNNWTTTPALNASGTATLNIDFGADTASLTLIGGGTAIFNQNPVFTGKDFSVDQNINAGNASGTFEGETGHTVSGNYYNDAGAGIGTSTGIYNVSTEQELY